MEIVGPISLSLVDYHAYLRRQGRKALNLATSEAQLGKYIGQVEGASDLYNSMNRHRIFISKAGGCAPCFWNRFMWLRLEPESAVRLGSPGGH